MGRRKRKVLLVTFKEVFALAFIAFVLLIFGFFGFRIAPKPSRPPTLTPGLEHPSLQRGVGAIFSKTNRDLETGRVISITLLEAPLRDLREARVLTEIPAGEDDCSFAGGFFSDDRRLYVHLWGVGGVSAGCSQDTLILRVKDLETDEIFLLPHKPQKNFSFQRILWQRDGKSFFFNWENGIYQFDLSSRKLLTVAEGSGPMGFVGYVGDGSRLYLSESEPGTNALYEYDMRARTKQFLIRIPQTGYKEGYWLSPNEQLILIPYRVNDKDGSQIGVGLSVFNIRLRTLWTVVKEGIDDHLKLRETANWYTLPPPRLSFIRTEQPYPFAVGKDTQIVLVEVEKRERQTVLLSSDDLSYLPHFWSSDGLTLAVERGGREEDLQLCFLLMEFAELRDHNLCIHDRDVSFIDYAEPQIKVGANFLDALNLFLPFQRILRFGY